MEVDCSHWWGTDDCHPKPRVLISLHHIPPVCIQHHFCPAELNSTRRLLCGAHTYRYTSVVHGTCVCGTRMHCVSTTRGPRVCRRRRTTTTRRSRACACTACYSHSFPLSFLPSYDDKSWMEHREKGTKYVLPLLLLLRCKVQTLQNEEKYILDERAREHGQGGHIVM